MREKFQDTESMDLNASDAIIRETTFLKKTSFFRKAAINPNNKDMPVSHAKCCWIAFKPSTSN
jgi:hypothetical protein